MRPYAKRAAQFTKVDEEHGIAYGWAIVSTVGGEPYYDLHGDHIPIDACIKAAARFMHKSRASDDQHDEVPHGFIPFCMPVQNGITSSLLGLEPNQEGLIIGAKCAPEVLGKIKAGERRGFSIGGGLYEAIYNAASGKKTGKSLRGRELVRADVAFVKAIAKDAQATQRRIFVDFDIDFISTVDWPAQEGALVSIVKSAGRDAIMWLSKTAYLTSEKDGHQHIVTFDGWRMSEDGQSGCTNYAYLTGADDSHSHDFVVADDGVVTIAANAGHSHALAQRAPIKPTPEIGAQESAGAAVVMSPVAARAPTTITETGQPAESRLASNVMDKDAEIASLRKQLAGLLVLAEMTDAEKTYRKALSARDAESFDAKLPSERLAIVKGADAADDVAYTCDDGTVIRKSQGALVEKMARRMDAQAAELAKAKDARERLELEKRAVKELAHYPGSPGARALIVKALDAIAADKSISDADKAEVKKAIAAGEKALAKGFRRVGKTVERTHGDVLTDSYEDPAEQLEKMAAEHAKEHKISFAKAYDAVLKTDEGLALYEESASTHPADVARRAAAMQDSAPEIDDYDDADGDVVVEDDGDDATAH